jgi:amino acid adenylation domain-containing protein
MDMLQDRSSLSPDQKRALLAELLTQRERQPRIVPGSFAQRRVWFLEKLNPASPANSIPSGLRIKGPLNIDALRLALNRIAQRHESIRTTLCETEGVIMQRILPELVFDLPVLDLTHVPEAERDAEARRLTQQEAVRPFDLSQGPLVRILLLRTSPRDYILLFNLHHIISDWWSMQLLLRELSLLYNMTVNNKPVELPGPPVQFSDYILWKEQELEKNGLREGLEYWAGVLAGAPAALELPADFPRPSVRTTSGEHEYRLLPDELNKKLKALGRDQRVTPFMLFLAAFKVLLMRYTGQSDIVVGTPIAGREHPEAQGVFGYLTNTVVLRTSLADDPTFNELLARVRACALQAFSHQDVPFEKLVELLSPARDLSHTPLFQMLFVHDHSLVESVQLTGLTLSRLEVNNPSAKYDLTLFVRETSAGLRVLIQYNTDLFRAETIKRMMGHYVTLLEGIASSPDLPVSLLPLMTEAEKTQTLIEWNQAPAHYSLDTCIHSLFEAQVERTPRAVAVVSDDEALTYDELNTRSNQLAHYLRRKGVGPEVLVGVYMERSSQMVAGLLSILKAGGAYLPLDPAYPPDRLEFMIKDSRVRFVLTTERLMPMLASRGLDLVCMTDLESRLLREDGENPRLPVGPDNLAYVIYTSGSTGHPKGAMLHHRGICNRLLWGVIDYKLGEGDKLLSKTQISFDVSVWEIFAPLICGACVIIAKQRGEQDGAYLVDLIRDKGVTHADFVPSMLQLFLSERGVESCKRLKRITAAGEPLSIDLQEQFFSKLNADLYNLYGPTEASLAVTYWHCRLATSLKSIPIGRPMSNIQIYLLDKCLQPVPAGISGELYIGGIAVGRGYLNRADLTSDRFIPDPFTASPGSRLYQTGDLARHLPDGTLEFLGREDQQVKVRGFRIELGEIEAVLSTHPLVRQTAVVTRKDSGGNERLVGYVLPKQPPLAPSELRRFLKDRLPEYMVPSVFVILEAMPLTQNGKADRQALPEPESIRPDLEVSYTPPATPLQQTIAAVWREVLGLEQVGVRDNFFDLGGHSLLLIQVQHKLQEVLRQEISMISLFKHSTIAQLAGFIRQEDDSESSLLRVKQRSQRQRSSANRRRPLTEERTG